MTREPLPHEAAKPFDYAQPTPNEMSLAIGSKKWCIARRSPRIVERYGEDVVCISPQGYAKAEAKAIANRGWARPCELVVIDMLGLLKIGSLSGPAVDDAINEAKALLERARNP